MKNYIQVFLLILLAAAGCLAQPPADKLPTEAIKIEANAAKGFAYPYYLYVPSELREAKAKKATHTILVLPNNTGKPDDSFEVHEAGVKKRTAQAAQIAALLKVAVLMPVFPRPATDWRIYTHALDREALITDKKEYARFDLQLIEMIDDARNRLKKENLKFDRRVLINGFSAAGMFANRFTFLHPTRVKAAVIGSPGGWAIAPSGKYKEKFLRYPIGIGDFKEVSGKNLDLKNLRKVPMFIFLGDKDDNDSVVFGDSYEESDKNLIFEIFGKTPVERWEITKALYQENKLNATFKLYPNVGHAVPTETRNDVMGFFKQYAQR
jgi:dienelactone hydrolase